MRNFGLKIREQREAYDFCEDDGGPMPLFGIMLVILAIAGSLGIAFLVARL